MLESLLKCSNFNLNLYKVYSDKLSFVKSAVISR